MGLLLGASHAGLASGWRTEGTLAPAEGTQFIYVGKFCFDWKGEKFDENGYAIGDPAGLLEILIEGDIKGNPAWEPVDEDKDKDKENLPSLPAFPPAPGGLYLAVFSDAEDQWQAVRSQWKNMTVEFLLDHAAAVRAVSPVLPAGRFAANVHVTETERPRFLYFVFVYWETQIFKDSIPVNYKIHAVNALKGYEKEFSVDEFGSLRLHAVGLFSFLFMVVFVLIAATNTYGTGVLWTRPLLRILVLSCVFSAINCAFRLAFDVQFSRKGTGKNSLEVWGELFASSARLLLTVLQLYIANGKALIESKDQRGRRALLSFLVLGIIVTSLGCEVYARFFGDLDWSTTLYFYASWPGFLIMAFNTAIFADVCHSTYNLYLLPEQNYRIKRFYTFSFLAAVVYFAALPATTILAHRLHPWDRKRVVIHVELAVRFVVTAVLFCVLRPSRLDKMINARMETGERREKAVQMTDRLSVDEEG